MNKTGFWNFSLKIGTSSRMTTRLPSRRLLVMLIVMGICGAAAPTDGLAAGLAVCVATGVATGVVGQFTGVAATGAVLHSRIDLAGGVGPTGSPALAVGAATGAVFHSAIDVAGGAVPTGSSAISGSIMVATSIGTASRASIPF